MKKIMRSTFGRLFNKNWGLAVTLTISCTLVLTSCSDDSSDNPVALSQSRVGYSAWGTQVSYTHCEPLPKTGTPEFVRGSIMK